jgi:microcystin-dependent protein
MSDPFVGEIRMFAGNFAPRSWAFCDGQLLAVSQNDALFSLLGTIYGGDGSTTFALPDMRGRLPVHQGTGPGLVQKSLGAKYGTERETLTTNQLPAHTHLFNATADIASSSSPSNNVIAGQSDGDTLYVANPTDTSKIQSFHGNTLTSTGGSQSHNNMMPSLCVHFIIALFGIYPSRN